MKKSKHEPVLLKESVENLKISNGIYVDCTLGGGGHTKEIVKNLKGKKNKLISFDVDSNAIKIFEKYLRENEWIEDKGKFRKKEIEIIIINGNFDNLKKNLKKLKVNKIDGLIADLGLSTDQIESDRGFSYVKDSQLDMRMDKSLNVKAKDLVNGLYEKELERLFRSQDEKYARRIAKEIVESRKQKSIDTTLHLVKIIQKALPFKYKGRVSNKTIVGSYWRKPVQRVFQALRIAVNSELSSLRKMLPQALEALASGKRMVIISFHSGEDRIVKNFFRDSGKQKKGNIINKKPITPCKREIMNNPRSSSAKMRVFEKF